MKLKINPQYRDLIPRPSKEDYTALEASIIEHGRAFEPIIVNRGHVILDGHTRYEICQKHGLPYSEEVREFDSELEEEAFVIEANLMRRQMSPYQRVVAAKGLEVVIAKRAKERQGQRTDLTFPSNEVEVAPIHTAEIIAKKIGVSRSTYERAKKIRDSHDLILKSKVLGGEVSISAAYTQLMPPEKAEPKQHEKISSYSAFQHGGGRHRDFKQAYDYLKNIFHIWDVGDLKNSDKEFSVIYKLSQEETRAKTFIDTAVDFMLLYESFYPDVGSFWRKGTDEPTDDDLELMKFIMKGTYWKMVQDDAAQLIRECNAKIDLLSKEEASP